MQLSALALVALLLVTPPSAAADDGTWTLELLTAAAAANGAVCLDGSPCVTGPPRRALGPSRNAVNLSLTDQGRVLFARAAQRQRVAGLHNLL